jgi:hypothetical protein
MEQRNLTDGFIVAIQGNNGVGKDTVASMLAYIAKTGITKAKFMDWLVKYKINKNSDETIIHFADKLKEICAVITGININYFNERKYKDELWWIYGTDCFVSEEDIKNLKYPQGLRLREGAQYAKINPNKFDIINYEETINLEKAIPIIKLRDVMIYIAEELIKLKWDKDYFVNVTKQKMINIHKTNGFCIIADERFNNEHMAVNSTDCYNLLRYKNRYHIYIGETLEYDEKTDKYKAGKFDFYIYNDKKDLSTLWINVLKFYYQFIFK